MRTRFFTCQTPRGASCCATGPRALRHNQSDRRQAPGTSRDGRTLHSEIAPTPPVSLRTGSRPDSPPDGPVSVRALPALSTTLWSRSYSPGYYRYATTVLRRARIVKPALQLSLIHISEPTRLGM